MAKASHKSGTNANVPAAVTDALIDSYKALSGALEHVDNYELPSMEEVAGVIDLSRALLFPGFVGPPLVRSTPTELRQHVRQQVDDLGALLRRQLYRGLHHRSQLEQGTHDLDCPSCAAKAEEMTDAFLLQLPEIRKMVALDVDAHFQGDPAANGTDEVIFCYPGLYAATVYRIAHALLRLGAQLIPRMLTEIAHKEVGIDIHPAAEIGRHFFIDHGTGIVIGETTVIGDRVRIYQGVTLGAVSVGKDAPAKRHPTIEDDVIIYSGATILGGETVIGEGAVIGGNCWVTSSVAAGATVTLDGELRTPKK
ncbi:MAG: serine acetyltransferase [Deltaproteobacteria bacterium]|nr:serine acetyltransferase [Deltaproteobacteria bacterium]